MFAPASISSVRTRASSCRLAHQVATSLVVGVYPWPTTLTLAPLATSERKMAFRALIALTQCNHDRGYLAIWAVTCETDACTV